MEGGIPDYDLAICDIIRIVYGLTASAVNELTLDSSDGKLYIIIIITIYHSKQTNAIRMKDKSLLGP